MLKKINALFASALLGLSLSSPVLSEALVEDFQTWGNVTAQGNFGFINPQNPDLKKFRWWMEGQGRFGNDSSQFSQGIIRPGIGYNITEKASVWLGYAWIPTSRPFALAHQYNENRIWQQLLWADNFSFGRLTSRSRFEQRFYDQDAPIAGSNDVMHRFRQFVKLAVPLPSIAPQLSFVVQDELFINMTDSKNMGFITQGFDQNRFFTGLAWKWNPVVTTEIGYMNLYFNRPHSARPDQMLHIIGVNLFMNF